MPDVVHRAALRDRKNSIFARHQLMTICAGVLPVSPEFRRRDIAHSAKPHLSVLYRAGDRRPPCPRWESRGLGGGAAKGRWCVHTQPNQTGVHRSWQILSAAMLRRYLGGYEHAVTHAAHRLADYRFGAVRLRRVVIVERVGRTELPARCGRSDEQPAWKPLLKRHRDSRATGKGRSHCNDNRLASG
jgi:hypothetical protein